jgi:hypothetical protein
MYNSFNIVDKYEIGKNSGVYAYFELSATGKSVIHLFLANSDSEAGVIYNGAAKRFFEDVVFNGNHPRK